MNEEKKYALKVWMDDSWLYVSEGPIDELRVCLMTLEEAQEAAEAWRIEGHEEAIEIVEYQECIS